MKSSSIGIVLTCLLLAGMVMTARADRVTATVPVGTSPYCAAVNPVTNRIYVTNGSGSVSVIDGATNATELVTVQSGPRAVAVNPVTNRIYAVNYGGTSKSVSVIDGATNEVITHIGLVSSQLYAVAVNPVTNRIYVAGFQGKTLTVIDGKNNSIITAVTVNGSANCVAVNPVTNKIYVTGASTGGNLTVIDGETNTPTTVVVGKSPYAVAVNPVTNRIYTANNGDNNVTVIDGTDNSIIATVLAGSGPTAVAVNPVTNKIYVANYYAVSGVNSMTVIDGETNNPTSVTVGATPVQVSVNPVTNKIYVANSGSASNSVTVIDGATNATTTVAVGAKPWAVAVNPVTNKIYIPNYGSGANSVTVIDGAAPTTVNVTVGTGPRSAALNPVTNRIYVANWTANNVSVINGATGGVIATVATGTNPLAVAVNPVTNTIYVANSASSGGNTVTVIDGATNNPTTVPVGARPWDVAVNTVTNRIYVPNYASASVSVLDGATGAVIATLPTRYNPIAVAVNPATNRIYVANYSRDNVTVIDGATNSTWDVTVGTSPKAVAVNTVTNKIYVANNGSGDVTVIDGATNSGTTVLAGTNPSAVAVNPATNKIYVANQGSANVTVIDGATNSTATASGGSGATAVAVNTVTNKIYVANSTSNNVTEIDGTTNSTTLVSVGTEPRAVAVNPVTNKIYAANNGSANVTVITDVSTSDAKVWAGVYKLTGDSTTLAQPTLTGKGVNRLGSQPNRTRIEGVSNWLNTPQRSGRWAEITAGAGTDSVTWEWNWSTDSLIMGENLLCAVALESDAAITNNEGPGSPFAGNLLVYPVYRWLAAPAAPVLVSPENGALGQPVDGSLFWNPAARASGYDVYLDKVNPPEARVCENLPGAAYDYSDLENGQTYYWRIAARNVGGTAQSVVWSFTTIVAAPSAFNLLTPVNGATGVAVAGDLTWEAATGAEDYDIYLGTASPPPLWQANVGNVTTYPYLGFANNTKYYWRVVAKNVGGSTPSVAEFDFTTIVAVPSAFILLTPGNGATGIALTGNLTWEPATGATDHDVYLGTTSPPPLYAENVGNVTTYPYSGLANNTLYYWAVEAKNAGGSIRCTEDFDFTTGAGWPEGWHEAKPMPEVPTDKPVKDGGWLAVGPDAITDVDVIYAAKGNKTTDFFKYAPTEGDSGTWHTLKSIPPEEGDKTKPPSKGCVGVSDGINFVYMTKGNNTLGFRRYNVDADSWELLPGVPEGPNRKKVKGGTDMVYAVYKDTGCVILLKGYKTEFYRYNTEAERWDTLPNAPAGGGKPKYDKGSFLAYDPAGYVYAHQAKYNDGANHYMFRYDIGTRYWDTCKGMPLAGWHGGKPGKNKKSKDGGAGDWYGENIHALKGGNTQQFFQYFPDDDSWQELDTVPGNGSTGKRKYVKYGADLVSYGGAFFALKGNKTFELWRFVIPASGLQLTANSRGGVMAGSGLSTVSRMLIAPNPLSAGFATVRFSLPTAGPVAVTVFDVAGRSVLATRSPGHLVTGSLLLDLRKQSNGVYLVRLDAEQFTATAKLVVQR